MVISVTAFGRVTKFLRSTGVNAPRRSTRSVTITMRSQHTPFNDNSLPLSGARTADFRLLGESKQYGLAAFKSGGFMAAVAERLVFRCAAATQSDLLTGPCESSGTAAKREIAGTKQGAVG
jgi:hypothetical protein